jgi:hypothetical protein
MNDQENTGVATSELEVIRIRPERAGPILGGGKLLSALDLFAQLKALAGRLNVEVDRLMEIMPALGVASAADYHTVDGMRTGLGAILTVADVLLIDAKTKAGLEELLDSSLISLAVWAYNKLSGFEPDRETLLAIEALSVPDLGKWLPLLLQIFELIRALKG